MPLIEEQIKVLIVEDEVIVAQDIALKLTKMGYVVIAVVSDANTALGILQSPNAIDIILLDISLRGDMTGIDLAHVINKTVKKPFIFLTSHTDTDIVRSAGDANPHAYILKPFNAQQINVSIELAIASYTQQCSTQDMPHVTQKQEAQMSVNDYLFLKKDTHFEKVAIVDILFFEADSNYTHIQTADQRFIYSVVLKKIEELVPHNLFKRIHRSFIVNIHAITGFEGNTLHVQHHRIPVSKSFQEQLFKNLPKI